MTSYRLPLTSVDVFRQHYDEGKAQLLWTREIADLGTPVSAALKLLTPEKQGFLLESVVGENRGRYSIIGLDPDLLWRCDGTQAFICTNPDADNPVFSAQSEPVFTSLRRLLDASHIDLPPELPPMAAGLIGYLGYDTVRLMEQLPNTNKDTLGIPDGLLMRPRSMVIFDAAAGVIYLCVAVYPSPRLDADTAYRHAMTRMEGLRTQLRTPLPNQTPLLIDETPPPGLPPRFTSSMSRADYHRMVTKAQEYIVAGDIFQVVPSQRFSAPFTHNPFAFYRALRFLNPSPFLFYLNLGNFQLIGSSPEILVRARDGTITVRPIAGTRRRGADMAEDAALAEELLADPKEVAEHLMLLDLGRNDVGRVAQAGTVTVTEQMVIERYSHVMHIVSNVEGRLRDDKDAIDALIAGFPAGTVSGAPKIRAMEIIDELEPVQRKFYAGCVGYFSANGSMDSCIALRTALIKDGTIHLQAGGGVVADSDPEAEYQESCNKAKALMRAAEIAANFVS